MACVGRGWVDYTCELGGDDLPLVMGVAAGGFLSRRAWVPRGPTVCAGLIQLQNYRITYIHTCIYIVYYSFSAIIYFTLSREVNILQCDHLKVPLT